MSRQSELSRSSDQRTRVTFFQRKPRSHGNFSFEFIFDDLRRRLARDIDATTRVAPFLSNGIVRRILIAFDAALHQSKVNHVTGDIHFATFLLLRKRTILTIHDSSFLHNSSGLKHWIAKTIWLSLPVWRSHVVTTISEASKREILGNTNCDSRKIHVIPNAISDKFTFSPKVFNSKKPRLLQVGTTQNKNVARLIEAICGLRCELDIIGKLDSSLVDQLKESEIRYANYVNISTNELLQLYRQCDMVVFASTFEGFGMPILEANAVGRPIVTSNVCSMPEVAGTAACLVDPFNIQSIRRGIEKVIEDSEYRASLVRNGQQNVLRFGGDEIARQYLNIYRSLSLGITPEPTNPLPATNKLDCPTSAGSI